MTHRLSHLSINAGKGARRQGRGSGGGGERESHVRTVTVKK